MDRRKIVSAALFLTLLGSLMILPPLAVMFQHERRLFGVPVRSDLPVHVLGSAHRGALTG
jgi:hypothetical protein